MEVVYSPSIQTVKGKGSPYKDIQDLKLVNWWISYYKYLQFLSENCSWPCWILWMQQINLCTFILFWFRTEVHCEPATGPDHGSLSKWCHCQHWCTTCDPYPLHTPPGAQSVWFGTHWAGGAVCGGWVWEVQEDRVSMNVYRILVNDKSYLRWTWRHKWCDLLHTTYSDLAAALHAHHNIGLCCRVYHDGGSQKL